MLFLVWGKEHFFLCACCNVVVFVYIISSAGNLSCSFSVISLGFAAKLISEGSGKLDDARDRCRRLHIVVCAKVVATSTGDFPCKIIDHTISINDT
jgi:hypothetical protein